MILHAATDGWYDISTLLDSLSPDAKREILSEGLSWALGMAVDENLDEAPVNNAVFEELARIGIVLVLRRAGLLREPMTTPPLPEPQDIGPEDFANLFGLADPPDKVK